MGVDDTTHKGEKGTEKTRGGTSQDTHHDTKEKEKEDTVLCEALGMGM